MTNLLMRLDPYRAKTNPNPVIPQPIENIVKFVRTAV